MKFKAGFAFCVIAVFTPMHLHQAGDDARKPIPSNTNVNTDVHTVTLPSGTQISVRIADRINTSKNRLNDLLTGIVDPSVLIDDHVVIPRGTEAHVRVAEDKRGGHLHGKAKLQLELIGLVMNGERLGTQTDLYSKSQGSLGAKAKAAGSPGAGAATDAAISPNPGGSVAAPVIAVFHAAKVELPENSRIAFTLTTPFTFDHPSSNVDVDNK